MVIIRDIVLTKVIYIHIYVCRHEIVGEVTQVGSKVTKFEVGDKAGVGCNASSCGECENCKQDFENYCPQVRLIFNG